MESRFDAIARGRWAQRFAAKVLAHPMAGALDDRTTAAIPLFGARAAAGALGRRQPGSSVDVVVVLADPHALNIMLAVSLAPTYGRLPVEEERLAELAATATRWGEAHAGVNAAIAAGAAPDDLDAARTLRETASAALEASVEGLTGSDLRPETTRYQEQAADALALATALARGGKRVVLLDASGSHATRGEDFRTRHGQDASLDGFDGDNLRAAAAVAGIRLIDPIANTAGVGPDLARDTEFLDQGEDVRAGKTFQERISPAEAREEAVLRARQAEPRVREVHHPAAAFTERALDGGRQLNKLGKALTTFNPDLATATDLDLRTLLVGEMTRRVSASDGTSLFRETEIEAAFREIQKRAAEPRGRGGRSAISDPPSSAPATCPPATSASACRRSSARRRTPTAAA